jgi:hypothetical protein
MGLVTALKDPLVDHDIVHCATVQGEYVSNCGYFLCIVSCLMRHGVDVNHHPVGHPKRKV